MILILADAVAAVHLAFMAYVIGAQILIVAGAAAGWAWIRNFWFRVSHLVLIAIVALESLVDFECPLTTWENMLRAAAGDTSGEGQTFIGRLVDHIMFFDHDKYYHIINLVYIAFAALVVATFLLAPPRRSKKAKTLSPVSHEGAHTPPSPKDVALK